MALSVCLFGPYTWPGKEVHDIGDPWPRLEEGQRSRSPGHLTPWPKISHIYWAGRPTSVKLISTSTSDWLERHVSEMTNNVLMGTLNLTHSVLEVEDGPAINVKCNRYHYQPTCWLVTHLCTYMHTVSFAVFICYFNCTAHRSLSGSRVARLLLNWLIDWYSKST